MSGAKPRICLGVTTRGQDRSFLDFIKYHLSLGIESIIVFFDDPNDAMIAEVRSIRGVIAVQCDDDYWETKRKTTKRKYCFKHKSGSVVARQNLNMESALQSAMLLGFDWLIHLDNDELLLPDESLPELFERIPEDVNQIIMANHEAVPEQFVIGNPFREVTLFKRNQFFYPLSKPRAKLLERTLGRKVLFNAYTNGKSAVRLKPGTTVIGPHDFLIPSGRSCLLNKMGVLHYPICGFDRYLSKYRLWGNFSNFIIGKKHNVGNLEMMRLHLQSRDSFASGDFSQMIEIYANRVMLSQNLLKRNLLKEGFLFKTTAVVDRLTSESIQANQAA